MDTHPASAPLERSDLGPVVADAIRRLILIGELQGGDRLVESELADRFGTSRGPVRDALTKLERHGLVVSRPRRGCVVRQLTVDDIEELYSLRIALESLGLRRLIALDPDPAATLSPLLERIAEAHATGDHLLIGEADMALHRAIVSGSRHTRLLQAWERLADETLLLMTELSSLGSAVQDPTGDHRMIVDFVAASDALRAEAVLVTHLESARDYMVSSRAS